MRIIVVTIAFLSMISVACSQNFKDVMSGAKDKVKEQTKNPGSSLTNEEVVNGLKEALTVGAENAATMASKTDGFNQNPKIRIPFPPDAMKVREKALELGLNNQVEKFETTLNRAAEEAAKEAAPIFINAVRNMSVQDGFDILNGNDDAATRYLDRNTSSQLRERFMPIVEEAIKKVELTKYWTPLANAYNTASVFSSNEAVEPDLDNYVTSLAMEGLFKLIADEEKNIRDNPAARVTDLLERVFGNKQ